MNLKTLLPAIAAVLLFTGMPAHAAGNLSIIEEIVLNASAGEIWESIGDFGGLDTWHPAVVQLTLTGAGTNAGDIRVLELPDGATITEELVKHDDDTRTYSYTILESPLPVTDYVSTLKVLPEVGDTARVVWSSSFNANGIPDEEAMNAIRGVYTGGFQALTERFPE